MSLVKFCLVVLPCLLGLTACSRRGRLYNLATGEVTLLVYKYGLSGHGTISGLFASGEKLSGEYATVPAGAVGWGQTYAAVQVAGVSGTGSANSLMIGTEADQHGAAIITGNRGSVLDCEYVTSALSGHGTGGCRDRQGALYRLMF